MFLITIQPFVYNFTLKNTEKFEKNKQISLDFISIQNEFSKKKFKNSIKKLESLKVIYPYPPYIQKIYIYLIYAYYKTSNFEKTKYIIEKFFQTYSTHKDIDFVLYVNGLIHSISEKQKFLKKILRKEIIENDVQKIYMALASFEEIINYHPHSKFLKNSKKNFFSLKNNLAKKELRIVQYYMKKGAYVSVINRSKKIFEEFPENEKIISKVSSHIRKIQDILNEP